MNPDAQAAPPTSRRTLENVVSAEFTRRAPVIVGVNFTLTAQDALAARLAGQVLVCEKSPEAAGLLAVSLGNSVLAGGDDRGALSRGFPVYDALYAWARHAGGETHNWPAKKA